MYAKSICLTCAALLLGLVGSAYGLVIGDWENSDDGWVIVGPEGTTMSYSDTDEVRLYNEALTVAQVAYLADLTPADGQLHVPVGSKAELSENEDPGSRSVNFKDFAILAQSWLDAQEWPWE